MVKTRLRGDACTVDHRSEHQIKIDRRHTPVDRFDDTPLDGAVGEVFSGKTLCLRRG
jgi:hypothetical protein